MTVYTVHLPAEGRDPDLIADDLCLVPERFSFGALLFGPFWLVWHRAYLATLGWIVVVAAVVAARRLLGLSPAGTGLIFVLVQIFLGFEGRQLERLALSHGRYRMVDVVSADASDMAEQVFLQRWTDMNTPPPIPAGRPMDLPGIGLFPGAGG